VQEADRVFRAAQPDAVAGLQVERDLTVEVHARVVGMRVAQLDVAVSLTI
jgi:hypothetical protein